MDSTKHGREESNETQGYTPSRSVSYTVACPPGYTPGSGTKAERNPLHSPMTLRFPPPTVPRDLSKATHEELIRYLEENKVPSDAITQVQEYGLTGNQWVGVYGRQGDEEDAAADLMRDYTSLCSLRARMLSWDARVALESMRESAEVEFTAKRNAAANVTQGGQQPREAQEAREPKERSKYKVEHAPKLFTPANKLMYTCSELTTLFQRIKLWTSPICKHLAAAMMTIQ